MKGLLQENVRPYISKWINHWRQPMAISLMDVDRDVGIPQDYVVDRDEAQDDPGLTETESDPDSDTDMNKKKDHNADDDDEEDEINMAQINRERAKSKNKFEKVPAKPRVTKIRIKVMKQAE